MKLYSGPLSLFTAKVRIALDEKGLAYEKISVGWDLANRYLPHHPEVVRLNPKHQVPVLVDGETVVYDSTLILEYLEERQPDPPLFPTGIAARARCRQLEAAADEVVFAHVWDLIEETFYPEPPGGRDPKRAQEARAALADLQEGLDRSLASSEGSFLCGDFTVADIGTFVMLNAATTLGAPANPALSELARWSAAVAERPAVAREVAATARYVAELFAAT